MFFREELHDVVGDRRSDALDRVEIADGGAATGGQSPDIEGKLVGRLLRGLLQAMARLGHGVASIGKRLIMPCQKLGRG
jgi:hypothetical protein